MAGACFSSKVNVGRQNIVANAVAVVVVAVVPLQQN